MMGDSAKKQEALNALNGISYNDWMEIKFKIDKYFSDQLSKYEKTDLNLVFTIHQFSLLKYFLLVIKESISNLKEESLLIYSIKTNQREVGSLMTDRRKGKTKWMK